jgi:hypothetical protein
MIVKRRIQRERTGYRVRCVWYATNPTLLERLHDEATQKRVSLSKLIADRLMADYEPHQVKV